MLWLRLWVLCDFVSTWGLLSVQKCFWLVSKELRRKDYLRQKICLNIPPHLYEKYFKNSTVWAIRELNGLFFSFKKKGCSGLKHIYVFIHASKECVCLLQQSKKSLGSLPIITMFNSTLLIAQLPDWSLKTLPVEAAHYNLLLLVSCFFSAVPLVFLVTVWFQRKILIRKSLTFCCLSVYDSLELQIQLRVFSSIYIMNKTFPSLYFLFDWTWKKRLPKI